MDFGDAIGGCPHNRVSPMVGLVAQVELKSGSDRQRMGATGSIPVGTRPSRQ